MTERAGLVVHKMAGPPEAAVNDQGEAVLVKSLAGVRLLDRQRLADGDGYVELESHPAGFRMPMDYADREPWVELVNTSVVHKPGGPAEAPWRVTHTFVHAEQIVLHLHSGDATYRVVHQPDKYDADGNPTDVAGDPSAVVDWFYDADLEAGE